MSVETAKQIIQQRVYICDKDLSESLEERKEIDHKRQIVQLKIEIHTENRNALNAILKELEQSK